MNPADLKTGDKVMARHTKPRGDRLPLITETHMVVEKVYPRDRLVVGRSIRRFVYVEGSPTLGQAVPLAMHEEAFDFNDLVSVLAPEGSKAGRPAEQGPLAGQPWENLPPFLGRDPSIVFASDLIKFLQEQPNMPVALDDFQAPGTCIDLRNALRQTLRQIQERIQQDLSEQQEEVEASVREHSDRPTA